MKEMKLYQLKLRIDQINEEVRKEMNTGVLKNIKSLTDARRIYNYIQ